MSMLGIAMALRGASSRLPAMFSGAAINNNVRHSDANMDHGRRAIGDTKVDNKPSGGSDQ